MRFAFSFCRGGKKGLQRKQTSMLCFRLKLDQVGSMIFAKVGLKARMSEDFLHKAPPSKPPFQAPVEASLSQTERYDCDPHAGICRSWADSDSNFATIVQSEWRRMRTQTAQKFGKFHSIWHRAGLGVGQSMPLMTADDSVRMEILIDRAEANLRSNRFNPLSG